MMKLVLRTILLLFFRALARINKLILPRYSNADLNRLSSIDKLIIAYRYFVTRNSLD